MNVDFPVQIYSYVVPAPAFGHKDYYAYNLLSDLLFGNSNSLLNQRLVNSNLAYQVVSGNYESRLYNNYAVNDIVMKAGIGNAKVKKVISKEIYDVINEGIEQELIDNYIRNLETQATFEKYSNAAISSELGFAEFYFKDYTKHDARLEAYKKIKADDLKMIAQTYYDPEKIKVINIKPLSE
jgi:predicted Zn-dependent peptidase